MACGGRMSTRRSDHRSNAVSSRVLYDAVNTATVRRGCDLILVHHAGYRWERPSHRSRLDRPKARRRRPTDGGRSLMRQEGGQPTDLLPEAVDRFIDDRGDG